MENEYEHTPVSVAGKSAVVIGGTSGIGRAIALGFAADGADVVAASRSDEAVAATADRIRDLGAETAELTCDITDEESVESLRDAAVDRFGGVDVLVNSAGAIARRSVDEVTDAEWERVFDVQLDGVARTTRAFADEMGTGCVVNVSSLSAVLGIPELAPYSAAKGGIDALTRAAATDLGPEIRVNAVRPGFVRTPQTADAYADGTDRRARIATRAVAGRLGDPEEVVGAAIYLASDAADYTTGEVLTVDGGFTVGTFE